jgi:outer membrane protein with beta-barrel domain
VFKPTCVLAVCAAIVAATPAPARAQSGERAFLNFGVGAQPERHSVTASTSFPVYDETATVSAEQHISNGPLFEIGGGARVTRSLAFGAAFSTFGRPGGGTLTASVPDPIFYNRPTSVSRDASDLEHKERSIHVQAMYFVPVNSKFDISLSAGPSFIHVSQELVTANVDTGSVTAARVTESGNAVGFNAGGQLNYLFTSRYGVGLFVGYAGGSVDLPHATDFKVGGFRTGLALQARF